MTDYEKIPLDPWPFRVGSVRMNTPGWLNGEHTIYDPRDSYGSTFREVNNGD